MLQVWDSEHILSLFLGVALGDALGAPHEFRCNSQQPYTGLLEYHPFHVNRFGVRRELPVGSVTDDTEMTIALLRTLIEKTVYHRPTVILSYLEWANSGGWAMGRNTKRLFKGVKTIRGYERRMAALSNEEKQNMQSNGCLMRASPLVLLGRDNPHIREDVYLTNPNELCYECVRIFVNSLADAFSFMEPHEIYRRALEEVRDPALEEVLISAGTPGERRDVQKNKGWILHAMWVAYRALLLFQDYSVTVQWIMSLGGDTDTNCSIASALYTATHNSFCLENSFVRRSLRIMERGAVPGRERWSFQELNRLVDYII